MSVVDSPEPDELDVGDVIVIDRSVGEIKSRTFATVIAIGAALRHLVVSHANLEDMKRDLTPDQAESLSTSELSLTMHPQIR